MPRNLNHRVEVVFPVERPEHIRYLRENVLETYIKDNLSARAMQPDGTYKRLHPADKEKGLEIQNWLMQNPSGRILR